MRFVLQDKIGEGAMGVVHRALDTATGETVAVKILPAKTASRDELLIARKITHRNVCRVFDLHTEGGRFFISMEFLEGETLRSYLDRAGRIDADEMLRIADQLIDGLEEAHRLGILHRDLKPENIMMLPDGSLKLMDFGLAHFIDPKGTLGSRLLGTPTHMAPEQLMGQPADVRTDIYSLGLILYEMVNGRQAFEGDSAGELLRKHVLDSPPAVRESVGLPGPVARAIFRCLEKEPSRRFASVEELRNSLVYGGDRGDVQRPPLYRRAFIVTSIVTALTALALAVFALMLRNQPGRTAVPIAPAAVSPPLLPKGLDGGLQSIAIFPFKNLQDDPKYKSFERSIAENVTASFSRSGRFRVVERSRLDELVGSLKAESPQKAGTMVGAQYLMFGSFQVFLGEIRIFAQIESTERGEALFTDMITGDVNKAPAVAQRFAEEMIVHLKAVNK